MSLLAVWHFHAVLVVEFLLTERKVVHLPLSENNSLLLSSCCFTPPCKVYTLGTPRSSYHYLVKICDRGVMLSSPLLGKPIDDAHFIYSLVSWPLQYDDLADTAATYLRLPPVKTVAKQLKMGIYSFLFVSNFSGSHIRYGNTQQKLQFKLIPNVSSVFEPWPKCGLRQTT